MFFARLFSFFVVGVLLFFSFAGTHSTGCSCSWAPERKKSGPKESERALVLRGVSHFETGHESHAWADARGIS